MPRRRSAVGQSTVELALVLPVLVIGLLVVVQVARVASDYVAVHHAAREAARQAAVQPDPGVVRGAVTRATPELAADRLGVDLGPSRRRGDLLDVTVHYSSPTDVPLVGRLIGDVDLSARAVVRVE